MRLAGLEPADHLVGAACNPAFAWTTAMFGTETLGVSVGGAARHGALCFLLSTAVCDAMLESSCCIGGAAIKLALSVRAMLDAETTYLSKGDAAFRLAHFVLAAGTAMPVAVSLFISGGCIAGVESAEPIGTMFQAETTNENSSITPIS